MKKSVKYIQQLMSNFIIYAAIISLHILLNLLSLAFFQDSVIFSDKKVENSIDRYLDIPNLQEFSWGKMGGN